MRHPPAKEDLISLEKWQTDQKTFSDTSAVSRTDLWIVDPDVYSAGFLSSISSNKFTRRSVGLDLNPSQSIFAR